ncbi:MAG: hypothetical protein WEK74_00625 [Hydrogenophaga sp.]
MRLSASISVEHLRERLGCFSNRKKPLRQLLKSMRFQRSSLSEHPKMSLKKGKSQSVLQRCAPFCAGEFLDGLRRLGAALQSAPCGARG